MNLLDLGVLILLGLVTVRVYFRGLFQELAFFVGVAGGVIVATHTYLLLAELLSRWITEPHYAKIIAFTVILVLVYWLTRLVAHFLQRLLYHLYLDFFERLLGAAVALAKGALIIGFGLMLLIMLPLFKDSRQFKDSGTSPRLIYLARESLRLLPPDFKKQFQGYLQELPKWWKRESREPEKQTKGQELPGGDLHQLKQNLGRAVDALNK
jgi:membrane protein required for colicin V production